MAAFFLAPFYILVNLYVLRWMFLWLGACNPVFQALGFRIIYAGIYILFSTSLLTGFLIKKPAPLHRCLKITGNYFLGIFLYGLTVILSADPVSYTHLDVYKRQISHPILISFLMPLSDSIRSASIDAASIPLVL